MKKCLYFAIVLVLAARDVVADEAPGSAAGENRWYLRTSAGAICVAFPSSGEALIPGGGPAASIGFSIRTIGAWRLGAAVGAAGFIVDGDLKPMPLVNFSAGYRFPSGLAVDVGVPILPSISVTLPSGLRFEFGAFPMYMPSGGSTVAYLLIGWELGF